MRKSGLHKQISSIFDGVPIPQNSVAVEEVNALSEQTQPQDMIQLESPDKTASVPPASGLSLAKRLTSNPSECGSAPSIRVGRPMPLPKAAIQPDPKTESGMSVQIKKAVFGSKGSMDPRQKKMAALVGILSVVFGAVMFVTLGGLGKGKAIAAAAGEGDADQPLAMTQKKTVEEWKVPKPLPEDLRDAAAPDVRQSPATQTQADPAQDTGELVVRGILFSRTKPSAIINEQILTEGQVLNGVTILHITRDAVEFEANGKRWTQSVQR